MTIVNGLLKRMQQKLRSWPRDSLISSEYSLAGEVKVPLNGWTSREVAARQHRAFTQLLEQARFGKPRLDFEVAARAIEESGMADPLVVEVGCGSGYYCEALPLLLKRPVRYIGIDYATEMTALAGSSYPSFSFVTADALRLPLRTGSCDILFSGTSLMHIPDYRAAIGESRRVARHWCVFHTVPVMENRSTTLLQKRAYGEYVAEVIFNQLELESYLSAEGLTVCARYRSLPYDVSSWVGEPTWTLTYLCEKTNA